MKLKHKIYVFFWQFGILPYKCPKHKKKLIPKKWGLYYHCPEKDCDVFPQ